MPSNKKSKTLPKELKQDKPKPNLKTPQKEDIQPTKAPKKRWEVRHRKHMVH